MDDRSQDKIIAFDTLFTNNQIQTYKIFLAYMPPSMQKNLCIYIKLMELLYTVSFFQHNPNAALDSFPRENPGNSYRFWDEITPFCDQNQKGKILQFRNMMQNFENMQEMMNTMKMMQELFPEATEGLSEGMDMSQLVNLLGGTNMSGMADIMNAFQAFQQSSSCDETKF